MFYYYSSLCPLHPSHSSLARNISISICPREKHYTVVYVNNVSRMSQYFMLGWFPSLACCISQTWVPCESGTCICHIVYFCVSRLEQLWAALLFLFLHLVMACAYAYSAMAVICLANLSSGITVQFCSPPSNSFSPLFVPRSPLPTLHLLSLSLYSFSL